MFEHNTILTVKSVAFCILDVAMNASLSGLSQILLPKSPLLDVDSSYLAAPISMRQVDQSSAISRSSPPPKTRTIWMRLLLLEFSLSTFLQLFSSSELSWHSSDETKA